MSGPCLYFVCGQRGREVGFGLERIFKCLAGCERLAYSLVGNLLAVNCKRYVKPAQVSASAVLYRHLYSLLSEAVARSRAQYLRNFYVCRVGNRLNCNRTEIKIVLVSRRCGAERYVERLAGLGVNEKIARLLVFLYIVVCSLLAGHVFHGSALARVHLHALAIHASAECVFHYQRAGLAWRYGRRNQPVVAVVEVVVLIGHFRRGAFFVEEPCGAVAVGINHGPCVELVNRLKCCCIDCVCMCRNNRQHKEK